MYILVSNKFTKTTSYPVTMMLFFSPYPTVGRPRCFMRFLTSSESSWRSERRYRLSLCWEMRSARLDGFVFFLLRRRAHCMLFFLSSGCSDWSLVVEFLWAVFSFQVSPRSRCPSPASTLMDIWDCGRREAVLKLQPLFDCDIPQNDDVIVSWQMRDMFPSLHAFQHAQLTLTFTLRSLYCNKRRTHRHPTRKEMQWWKMGANKANKMIRRPKNSTGNSKYVVFTILSFVMKRWEMNSVTLDSVGFWDRPDLKNVCLIIRNWDFKSECEFPSPVFVSYKWSYQPMIKETGANRSKGCMNNWPTAISGHDVEREWRWEEKHM